LDTFIETLIFINKKSLKSRRFQAFKFFVAELLKTF